MSTDQRYFYFADIDAPLLLSDSPEILPTIQKIMPGWPLEQRKACGPTPPFFTVRPGDKPGKYHVKGTSPSAKPKHLDAINASCDLAAEISVEPSFLNKALLCMHTAAVEMNGRLLLFPNSRMAGKSTLSISLAARGHRIFTDDFLSLSVDAKNRICAKANGILPRARLPLPDGMAEDIAKGVDHANCVENKQYRYVAPFELPKQGTTSLVGAIVLLDRVEGATPTLHRTEADETIGALLYQNFGRHVHSGVTLTLLHFLAMNLPVYRMEYSNVTDASVFLEEQFPEWNGPVPQLGSEDALLVDAPEFIDPPRPRAFKPDAAYTLAPGAIVKEAGETTFVSDREGRGVHRMDSLTKIIWSLLEEPMRFGEVFEILESVFSDAPSEQLNDDLTKLMKFLNRSGLIAPTEQV